MSFGKRGATSPAISRVVRQTASGADEFDLTGIVGASRGAKPGAKLTPKNRQRILVAALAAGIAYIAMMQPQRMESLAHNLGIPLDLGSSSSRSYGRLVIESDVNATLPIVAGAAGGAGMGTPAAGGALSRTGAARGLSLEAFWAKQKSPSAGDTDFAVRAGLSTSSGNVEQIWVRSVVREGATVTGVVVNDSRDPDGLRQGSQVSFESGQITDWTFKQYGRAFGN